MENLLKKHEQTYILKRIRKKKFTKELKNGYEIAVNIKKSSSGFQKLPEIEVRKEMHLAKRNIQFAVNPEPERRSHDFGSKIEHRWKIKRGLKIVNKHD